MKNNFYIIFLMANGILLSLSTAIFADVTAINTVTSSSAKSSVSNRSMPQESAITNEAEYAEFVRRNEKSGQASSVKSVISHSTSSGSSQKAIK